MMMFALLSVLECPACGASLPFLDMGFGAEPLLKLVKCENCGGEFQIRYDQETGKVAIESTRVS